MSDALADLLARWAVDPVSFVREALGVEAIERWQLEVLRALPESEYLAIRSGRGVGKALAHRTLTATPGGWVGIGDLKVGDLVYAVDGTPTEVLGVYPQGERELWRVCFDDGTSLVVDDDHLWRTTTHRERKAWARAEKPRVPPFGVRTTREIRETLFQGRRGDVNHAIPTCAALEGVEAVLPVEPYTLGVWLGDGHADGGRYTKPDGAVAEELFAVGQTVGIANAGGTRTVKGLVKGLRLLGLHGHRSWERFVPDVYRWASARQRHAVLQGILDTDGTVGRNGAVVLDVTAPLLADHVAEIVRSLGGQVRRSEKMGRYGGKVCRRVYRLYIALPEGWPPFRAATKANRYKPNHDHRDRKRTLTRYIVGVHPAGRGNATCIRVAHPTGLFVAENHIVTHNSALLAWAILWWMTTRFPAKALCTAPKADQLSDVLWSEIALWMRNMPPQLAGMYDLQSDALRLRGVEKEVFAVARTAKKENSEAFQGIRSANTMLVADEASGIDDVIFEVAEGSMSGGGAKMILAGNPTRTQGYFYSAFHKMRSFWRLFHVPCSASSRVKPEWIERMGRKYGVESPWYKVHVLGEFPEGDDDAVIPLHLVESAVDRDVEPYHDAAVVWGVDVARYGDDATALAKRRGNVLLEPVVAWRGADTMQTVGRIVDQYHRAAEKPAFICVDVIGLGAGVADRLREQGLPARGVSVSEQPSVEGRYNRLRDELWWRAREWFQALDCRIPNDDELMGELTGPTYTFLSSGKIKVESKDDMKARLGAEGGSPDKADAFCLTFALGRVSKAAYRTKIAYDDRPWV